MDFQTLARFPFKLLSQYINLPPRRHALYSHPSLVSIAFYFYHAPPFILLYFYPTAPPHYLLPILKMGQSNSTFVVVLQEVFGYLGLAAWSIQLIPQVIHSYRRKSAAGVSPYMMGIWYIGSIMFLAYLILQRFPLPVILQPCSFSILSLICTFQYFIYELKFSNKKLYSLLAVTLLLSGGLFALFYLPTRQAYLNHIEWPLLVVGLIPTVLFSCAYLAQYYELFKTGNPDGLNKTFLKIDSLGAICFLVSVSLEHPFDGIAFYEYFSSLLFNIGLYVWCVMLQRKQSHDQMIEIRQNDEVIV